MKFWHEHLLNNVTVYWPKEGEECVDCGIIMESKITKMVKRKCVGKSWIISKITIYVFTPERRTKKEIPNACQSLFWTNNPEILFFLSRLYDLVVCHFDSCILLFIPSIKLSSLQFIHHFYLLILSSVDVNYIKPNERRVIMWMEMCVCMCVQRLENQHFNTENSVFNVSLTCIFYQFALFIFIIICNNEITIL